METHTRGNVIVEKIKIGDIHYEYDCNVGIKMEVITKPKLNKDNQYEWESKIISNGNIINYLVDPKYSHYSAKLYDHEAYTVNVLI